MYDNDLSAVDRTECKSGMNFACKKVQMRMKMEKITKF